MQRVATPRRAAAAGCLALLLLASCSPQENTAREDPARQDPARQDPAREKGAPPRPARPEPPAVLDRAALARVKGTEAQRKRLHLAQEQLVARCMTVRGFRYRPSPWFVPRTPGEDDPRRGDEVERRREDGYEAAANLRKAQLPADPNAAYVNSLTAARRTSYTAALFGTLGHKVKAELPDGSETYMYADGCNARALNRLYGDLAVWMRAQMVATNLDTEIDRRILEDKRVKALDAPWSRCMAAAGHRYRSTSAARSAVFDGYDKALRKKSARGEATAKRRETAVAVADATCDASVGRARLVRSLDHHYREQVAADRSREIATYQSLRAKALLRVAGEEDGSRRG
ncbi:hypothetical protein [Streptomyces aureocirculatus]|uniref:hypothetical protein n=1 Tax=Streptomyces aureocirculatus TaxID=67275 RepID=UPI0012FF3E1D|nr:hypothetical protein [Streptomyces aureocirculatus]